MFKQTLKKMAVGAVAVLSLGVATMASTSASAYPWHGGWGWRGGWGPGAAVGAGLLGVAIGASLAHPYYGPPPPAYAGPGYWGYYGGCRSYWRWEPQWGRYVRVERCY